MHYLPGWRSLTHRIRPRGLYPDLAAVRLASGGHELSAANGRLIVGWG